MSYSIVRGSQSALGGAATGATLGSAVPGIGTAVGAGIGAVIGLLGGFGGSGGGGYGPSGKKIKDAINATNKQQLKDLKDAVAEAAVLAGQTELFYNAEAQRAYGERLKEFQAYIKQREADFNEAHDLFTDSVDTFNQTVELNDISAQIAINDAKGVYNDRIYELGNQQMSIVIDQNLNNLTTANTQSLITEQFNNNTTSAGLDHKTIREQVGSTIDIAESELEVKDLNIQAEVSKLTADSTQIQDSMALRESEIFSQLDLQIAQTDIAQRTLELQKDEKYAEASIQTNEQIRKGLVEQGAQIAKGQAGRSALKNVQGLAFQSGQAQTLIASALTRADAKFLIDKESLVEQLSFARTQGSNALEAEAIKGQRAAAEFGIASTNLEATSKGLDIDKRRIENAAAIGDIDMDKVTLNLLSSQQNLYNQFSNNSLSLDAANAQVALSLDSIDYARGSAQDELVKAQDEINFDVYRSNLAAASQVLDEPVLPEPLPPPEPAPEFIQQPLPDINWDKIEEIMNKRKGARMGTDITSLDSGFGEIASILQTSLESAATIAQAFKDQNPPISQQPTQPTFKAPEGVFDIVGNNGFDYNASVDFDLGFDPTPRTSNVNFNAAPVGDFTTAPTDFAITPPSSFDTTAITN